jgi:hypothetical protein
MGVRATAALAVSGLAGLLLMGGCAEDAICSSGSYPVVAVRGTGGGDCVEDDQEPPAGFVRYPAGRVPQHVDDEWDRYWYDHQLDENGREISGRPAAAGQPGIK